MGIRSAQNSPPHSVSAHKSGPSPTNEKLQRFKTRFCTGTVQEQHPIFNACFLEDNIPRNQGGVPRTFVNGAELKIGAGQIPGLGNDWNSIDREVLGGCCRLPHSNLLAPKFHYQTSQDIHHEGLESVCRSATVKRHKSPAGLSFTTTPKNTSST